MLLRYTSGFKPRNNRIFVATPLVCWTVAEPRDKGKTGSLMVCWLSLLLEAVQILGLPEFEAEMVLVRTNIRKLAAVIDSDCYVRSLEGAHITSEIHDNLSWSNNSTEEVIPMELRAVLLELQEDKLSDCVATLLN